MQPSDALKRIAIAPHRAWRWPALVALALGASITTGAELATSSAPTSYRVLKLSGDRYASGIDINASGQVIFTEHVAGGTRARFYDGHAVRDLGTLGGPNASTRALNDLGQVIGQSDADRKGTISHAYRWSRSTGMLDLDAGNKNGSTVSDINERGDVAGAGWVSVAGAQQYLGFFWSPRSGKITVGGFGEGSAATALNNSGTVVGYASGPLDGLYSSLAFRWTRREGISDLGTLPNEFTWATDVNDAGQVVGATPFGPGQSTHAFVWTPRQGLRDLGTGSAERSSATHINEHGVVIGYVITLGTVFHGFVWDRDTGMHEFGAGHPDIETTTGDINRADQVVGSYGGHAFEWTSAHGMVDLNTRLIGAPSDLVLTNGYAISDKGAIVAGSSTGLYLLMPRFK